MLSMLRVSEGNLLCMSVLIDYKAINYLVPRHMVTSPSHFRVQNAFIANILPQLQCERNLLKCDFKLIHY